MAAKTEQAAVAALSAQTLNVGTHLLLKAAQNSAPAHEAIWTRAKMRERPARLPDWEVRRALRSTGGGGSHRSCTLSRSCSPSTGGPLRHSAVTMTCGGMRQPLRGLPLRMSRATSSVSSMENLGQKRTLLRFPVAVRFFPEADIPGIRSMSVLCHELPRRPGAPIGGWLSEQHLECHPETDS